MTNTSTATVATETKIMCKRCRNDFPPEQIEGDICGNCFDDIRQEEMIDVTQA